MNSLLHPQKNVTVCDLGFSHSLFQLLLLSVVSLEINLGTLFGSFAVCVSYLLGSLLGSGFGKSPGQL